VAKKDCPRLLIGAEDPLDGKPELSGSGLLILHGKAKDGVVDGAEYARAEAAVRPIPFRVLRMCLHSVV
jgi:hypothetical protein